MFHMNNNSLATIYAAAASEESISLTVWALSHLVFATKWTVTTFRGQYFSTKTAFARDESFFIDPLLIEKFLLDKIDQQDRHHQRNHNQQIMPQCQNMKLFEQIKQCSEKCLGNQIQYKFYEFKEDRY